MFVVIDDTHVKATVVAINRALFEDHATRHLKTKHFTLSPEAANTLADTHTPCERPFVTAEGRTVIWTPRLDVKAPYYATTAHGHLYTLGKK